MSSTDRQMSTIGRSRVRVSFNPSEKSFVDQIKNKTAELIDLCDQAEVDAVGGEVKRLWKLAETAYEEAAMWAVKAATA